jgi:hypothetical protein
MRAGRDGREVGGWARAARSASLSFSGSGPVSGRSGSGSTITNLPLSVPWYRSRSRGASPFTSTTGPLTVPGVDGVQARG